MTRRFEEGAEEHDREFGVLKSDLTAVGLQIGSPDQKVGASGRQTDRNQGQSIELLAQPVGQRPDAG